jgi:hypothetical protein
MVMVRNQRLFNAVVLQQRRRMACILTGNAINRTENIKRSQRYISLVAKGRANDI